MEKEFACFMQLDNQAEKILELVAKLKEENRKLRSENELLLNKYQSIDSERSKIDTPEDELIVTDSNGGLSEEKAASIRLRIKNALIQLEKLRQIMKNDL